MLHCNGVEIPERFGRKRTYWSKAFTEWLLSVELLSPTNHSIRFAVSQVEAMCLVLKKVDSQQSHIMYYLQTEKQRKYFKETIRLHYERGYGEDRISRILPIGHATVSRWIAIFEREKGNVFGMQSDGKSQPHPAPAESDVKALQSRIKELEKRLRMAEIKAEAYDEMINVAEAKFKIPIRKKAGAKR